MITKCKKYFLKEILDCFFFFVLILAEQQLYKLYAQTLADSEVTQDWSSWVEMMTINCQKCCSEAEVSHPIAYRTGRQP